ncbi:MAG: hypothetical protein AYK18_13565 [Theionarchaea archaeon DG-70]|nr:MAG: hypothetical protein AYK18_13565 [Theionarchaea archaeon DG-70]
MERIETSIGHRVRNPIVQTLSKHLRVETEIFKAKNDFYSSNWGILALVNANEEIDILESSIDELEKEAKEIIKEEYTITTELVIKFALCEKILKLKGRKNQYMTKSIKILLERSRDRNWLNSQETVSMLLFLLNDCGFSSELDEAYKWLRNKNEQFIQSRNYPNAIDSSLGLLSYKNEIELPFEELVRNIEHQSIERTSKLLMIVMKSGKNEYQNNLITILENKLKNKFKNWIFPDLEMTLFEGVSLMKSNIPKQEIDGILDNLRKDSIEWANSIDITENGILLKNVDLREFPYLNSKEDALSMLALLEAERDTVYQLNKEEYELANNALREHKEGYTGIKKNQLQYLFDFSLILIFLFFLVSTYSLDILPDPIELIESPSVYPLVKAFGYYSILVILAIYYYRVGVKIIHHGEIGKKDLVLLFPGIGFLYSWIGGRIK